MLSMMTGYSHVPQSHDLMAPTSGSYLAASALAASKVTCLYDGFPVRAYPNNPAARKAMSAQEKWRKAM